MIDYKSRMRIEQVDWRRRNLGNQARGRQSHGSYDHVLPYDLWELNLWPGINHESSNPLPQYLEAGRIKRHTGSHNLLSSWILCANLYFPFRSEAGMQMLTGFLQQNVSTAIQTVTRVELEYESGDDRLKPPALLGEADGGRGTGQTSPDVAFEVDTTSGSGVILVECKFTEHSFYACSGRKRPHSDGRTPNPNPSRCRNAIAVVESPATQCHLSTWQRKYWEYLDSVANCDAFFRLKACPAAYGGYQLFRQQALAEGMARIGQLGLVVSCVAYDGRNRELMACMKHSTGLADIQSDWAGLFSGQSGFKTFTHQEWVTWVAEQDRVGEWNRWLQYIRGRYGL